MILLILGMRVAAEARARELEKTVKKAGADAQKATLQAERAEKTHEANIERTERAERAAAQQSAAHGTGQGVYGKGFGEGDWLSLIKSGMAGDFVPAIERVDRVVRMDASTSAAMIGSWLRPKLVRLGF